MTLNRHQRRAMQKEQHAFVKEQRLPAVMTPIPTHEWPLSLRVEGREAPLIIWRSNKYLAQLWRETNPDYPDLQRLSVCRITTNSKLGWNDGLTWDELQQIKRECGYGDFYAVEVYPPDDEVVNVKNFRHLWLLVEPLSIGWFK